MAVSTRNISDDIIVVGDRVDLVTPSGLVYRALIEDRIDDGPFLVAIPSRKGALMPVAQDDGIYLVFYRDSGRYIAQMKVIGLERRMDTRYMWLLQRTQAQKNQRREAYRLPVAFSVQIYEYDENAEQSPATGANDAARAMALERADSRDLSVTGIALITKKQYMPEERYVLAMQMTPTTATIRARREPSATPPIQLTAAVRRCIPWRTSGKYNTGMQFLGITRETSEDIARFVLTEQQRQIRMRRQ